MRWKSRACSPSARPRRNLKLGPTKELGRYPRIPYEVVVTPAGVTRAPAVVDAHETANRTLQAEIAKRLASSPRKEMVLYVHGVKNSFIDAAFTMGEMCHFLGREFVCAFFTWPAGGKRGILFGYGTGLRIEHIRGRAPAEGDPHDRGTAPGLGREFDILAHRPAGPTWSPPRCRELSFESYMQQMTLPRRAKLGNVVLMAPDMDVEVAPEKLLAIMSDPDLPHGPRPDPRAVFAALRPFHLTIYVSPDDKALATSGWLFGSLARLGRIDTSVLTREQIELSARLGFLDVIQIRGTTDLFGHGYFVSNPRVSADLIALIRYGLKPNEPGRPLEEIERPFWRIPTGAIAGGAD